MERPVFYDASGRRNRWTVRAFIAFLLVLIVSAGGFAATLVDVPVPKPLALVMELPRPRPLALQITHFGHKLKALRASVASWLPDGRRIPPVSQIKVGFYVPWDDASRASLASHIRQLDWVVPGLYSITGPAHALTIFSDPKLDTLLATAPKKAEVLPMFQNALNGVWDRQGIVTLLANHAARTLLIDRIERELTAHKAAGAVFDFEELPASSQRDYLQFLREVRARFAHHGWLVTLSVPVGDPSWNLAAYARVADRLFIMDYDENTPESDAGPVASQAWFVRQMRQALSAVPRSKAIIAIGSYAYDWTGPGKGTPLSTEEAWLAAHDSEVKIQFDKASGNAHFSYAEGGATHNVWMLDAASAWNQLRAADAEGVAGVALWRLGTEDPGVWKALASFETGKVPDLRALRTIGDVDVEGSGEILRIDSTPSVGHRHIRSSPNRLIVDEYYRDLPTPFVVERTGYHPGWVALTFDDGPDPDWTPKILAILKAKHVPATFFVVGENAMEHPFLLQRIINQGSEIGNHSFTHPNLAKESGEGTMLELNSTRRLVEAYTGRSPRLFRAPYFGDAEPTTTEELEPALRAQQDGYTNVGLHVDPGDWKRPGADAIVQRTLHQVASESPDRSEQVILLHDGGGDRTQTVAALPRIIDQLRAQGYRFVPVSALAGLTPAQVMPPVLGNDLLAVRADIGMFLVFAGLEYVLKAIFFAAIALGIGRAILMAALAWNSNRPVNRIVAPPINPNLFVSVLIPAYNEARVIAASVRRVLGSRDVGLEIIVIDDGSKDDTSAIVARTFADEPRVRLLTLENGGKARALNRGLEWAKGDIVIALDADTHFEAETIARLARWFDDPEIGAVAGNAKVGNRVNLVTRWQAVEYVTAQNLERRALAQFDAIMVVPGAVGAWRRAALDEVGGYPVDTLAEDQDLTIAIQRKGWRVGYDVDAVAWTEAPETFRALSKQRFRWAFGTLQCLWKHRAIVREGKPAGLAAIGVPQAWIFQIGFALISPLIDLALLVSLIGTLVSVQQHGWEQTQSDVLRMGIYWVLFTLFDVLCGWVAYRLEARETRYPALLLVAQRFVYRQLMYSVVIRAVANALRGPRVGWGKLERTGRVASA
ncbi:glycosyltransferase [Sphingobium subterraneum]|uniref:Chitooligosaccharide deacetylase n=1 Tax=Sphingobium subterraneum TaxID=627688 RepID=A0A841J862_9SPHN|nr:glycosyltransferase [Sphingobium subterraneum]MBB6124715.1 cellulose synthase/poly-beta-1,6-N-acetylglucosamine synthase-like glycosyltransferase/peptidoglycan/xylan/chitin deacetylase (PgdA/CDA1 family)/spore germination protein YaaH [Sphingobium subterraneum]